MARDTRPWIKLTTQFTGHPKIMQLPLPARWLLVDLIATSATYGMDGRVPALTAQQRAFQVAVSATEFATTFMQDAMRDAMQSALREAMPDGLQTAMQSALRDAVQEVADGLLESLTHNDAFNPSLTFEESDGGVYVIHDYLEHQESRETITARKARTRAAANARWDAHRNAKRNASRNANSNTSSNTSSNANSNAKRNAELELELELSNPPASQSPLAKKPASRGSRLPEDWMPSQTAQQWTMDQPGIQGLDVRRELERFRDFWLAKSGANATKRDWDATWRNWVRKALDDLAARASRGRNQDQIARDNLAAAVAEDTQNTAPLRLIQAGQA